MLDIDEAVDRHADEERGSLSGLSVSLDHELIVPRGSICPQLNRLTRHPHTEQPDLARQTGARPDTGSPAEYETGASREHAGACPHRVLVCLATGPVTTSGHRRSPSGGRHADTHRRRRTPRCGSELDSRSAATHRNPKHAVRLRTAEAGLRLSVAVKRDSRHRVPQRCRDMAQSTGDDRKLPECHEGEAAGERFSDALRTIFAVPTDRAAAIRASSGVSAGVNQGSASDRVPGRSASSRSRGDRRHEPTPA